MAVNLTPKQLLDRLGLQYREMSNRLLLVCPFHPDRNPSSNFYYSSGLFFCFACELTLDVVSFYAKFKQLSRAKAEFELILTHGGVAEERRADPIDLARVRHWGESLLVGKRGRVDRKCHASLGEQLDKILYCYGRKLLTEEQFGIAVRKWQIRVEAAGEEGAEID